MKGWQIDRTAGIFTTVARKRWLMHQCFCRGLPVVAFLLKWERKETIFDWDKALPRQLERSWNTAITKSLKLYVCCSWGKTHQQVLQIIQLGQGKDLKEMNLSLKNKSLWYDSALVGHCVILLTRLAASWARWQARAGGKGAGKHPFHTAWKGALQQGGKPVLENSSVFTSTLWLFHLSHFWKTTGKPGSILKWKQTGSRSRLVISQHHLLSCQV